MNNLQVVWNVFYTLCGITAIAMMLTRFIPEDTKLGKMQRQFFKKYKIIGIILIVMTAIGLFGAIFTATIGS